MAAATKRRGDAVQPVSAPPALVARPCRACGVEHPRKKLSTFSELCLPCLKRILGKQYDKRLNFFEG